MTHLDLPDCILGVPRRGERLPQSIASPRLGPDAQSAVPRPLPLCVDLDGTLVKSDTLVDSLLALVRNRPALIFKLPGRVLQGKAAFKAFVTESIALDVTHLPYNQTLLEFLRSEHARGRALYLATGADVHLARRVADHLGIFTGVLGSDGTTNLTGNKKLDTLRSRLGSGGFDYIGNDTPDVPLLAHATQPMVANPSLRLRMKLRAHGIRPSRAFVERKPVLSSLLKAVRLHQWAKNLLVFVPLLCSHALTTSKLLAALAAFFCFSITASSAYIVNDLFDIEADRRHQQKHGRPFAAGDLSPFTGVAIAAFFLVVGLAGARLLPGRFFACLIAYLATTLAYTLFLKRFALVDVLALSGLYILRLLAGGSVTGTPISHWLAGFSMFLFLSLAIVKRFAELENLRSENAMPTNGRGYLVADLDQLRSFGTASAYAAVVVFAIYITGPDVVKLYRYPNLLWLSVPLITLWLNRVWLLASRAQLDEDPLAFALTDPMSLIIVAGVLVVALLAH
jgi:4-hydroxybenzoate polyprenyltransferase/phosphoserine phosphatase